MSIQKLCQTVKPPAQALETGTQDQWSSIEKQIKFKLPEDLRDFGIRYGSGKFFPPGLIVFNPFAKHYLDRVEAEAAGWRALKAGEGEREVPFDVFPKSPGLMPWGADENGCGLFWLTKGKPSSWPLVVRPHENPEYVHFEMQLTTFLGRAFARELDTGIWPGSFFKKRKPIIFQPSELLFEKPVPLRSLLDIYKENGNRAGFWVQHASLIGSDEFYYVKTIDGNSSGPIKGRPDLAAVVVTADVFERTRKAATDYQLPTDPTADAYQVVDPPV